MNHIFDNLIKSKIEKFVFDFKHLSKQIFVDENGSQIHSGEFGGYRERIVADLIQPFLPSRLDIGTGFIICHNDKISTQCDIIIYDKECTPFIDNYGQRFFPVECVVGVIEVKSCLTKSSFKEALIKLSNIKKLKKESSNKIYVFKDKSKQTEFDPDKFIYDQIASFIVCDSIDYDFTDKVDNFFADVYKDIDKSLYHNMVLSLSDGCFLYRDNQKKVIFCPYYNYSDKPFENVLLASHPLGYKYEHIAAFLNYFFMLISSASSLYFEFTYYLGSTRIKKLIK